MSDEDFKRYLEVKKLFKRKRKTLPKLWLGRLHCLLDNHIESPLLSGVEGRICLRCRKIDIAYPYYPIFKIQEVWNGKL